MIYTSIPAWRTGDLVSAARLNQMADGLDEIVGLEGARQIAYDSGADGVTNGGLYTRSHGYPEWTGKRVDIWVAHNGDTLHIWHGSPAGTTAILTYDYDGDHPQVTAGLTPNVDHAITIDGSHYYQYQPVRIRVEQANMNADPGLFVRYLYQTSSTRPTGLTPPAFVNGAVSSANDFNGVLDDMETAYTTFCQPVAAFYHMPYISKFTPSIDGGAKGGLTSYVQHWHDDFHFDMVINGPNNNNGYDYAYWIYNGQVIWSIRLRHDGTGTGPKNPGNGTYSRWDGETHVSLSGQGLSLTPGNWYSAVFYYHRIDTYHDRGENVAIWSFGEQADNHILTAPTRWTHGDTVNGNAGDTPLLSRLSASLNTLEGSLRWYNPACRQASSRMSPDWSDNEVLDQMASFRVHRWLAYENFLLANGERANAQIQWRTGEGRTLQSYSLPEVEGPSFFDLESTPVKTGMYMRFSGVKFAIQTPRPGEYDYA